MMHRVTPLIRHLCLNYTHCIYCFGQGRRFKVVQAQPGDGDSTESLRRFKIRRAAAIKAHLRAEHPDVKP